MPCHLNLALVLFLKIEKNARSIYIFTKQLYKFIIGPKQKQNPIYKTQTSLKKCKWEIFNDSCQRRLKKTNFVKLIHIRFTTYLVVTSLSFCVLCLTKPFSYVQISKGGRDVVSDLGGIMFSLSRFAFLLQKWRKVNSIIILLYMN